MDKLIYDTRTQDNTYPPPEIQHIHTLEDLIFTLEFISEDDSPSTESGIANASADDRKELVPLLYELYT